jgi:hypothetical protein
VESRFLRCTEFTQQDVSARRHAPRTAHLHARAMHAAGHLTGLRPMRPSPYSPRHASVVLRQKREAAVCRHRLAAISAPPQPLLRLSALPLHSLTSPPGPPPHHHATAQSPGRVCTEHGWPQWLCRGHSTADARRPCPSFVQPSKRSSR